MRSLDKKLVRDLLRLWGQILAIAFHIADKGSPDTIEAFLPEYW
jgi:hypothetical protein